MNITSKELQELSKKLNTRKEQEKLNIELFRNEKTTISTIYNPKTTDDDYIFDLAEDVGLTKENILAYITKSNTLIYKRMQNLYKNVGTTVATKGYIDDIKKIKKTLIKEQKMFNEEYEIVNLTKADLEQFKLNEKYDLTNLYKIFFSQLEFLNPETVTSTVSGSKKHTQKILKTIFRKTGRSEKDVKQFIKNNNNNYKQINQYLRILGYIEKGVWSKNREELKTISSTTLGLYAERIFKNIVSNKPLDTDYLESISKTFEKFYRLQLDNAMTEEEWEDTYLNEGGRLVNNDVLNEEQKQILEMAGLIRKTITREGKIRYEKN